MKVRFTPGARAQLMRIHAHISEDNPYAADKVVFRIESVAALLGQHPYMGRRLRRRPERMIIAKPYSYLIFYRLLGDTVHITRVRHPAQRRPMLQEAAAEFRR